MEPQRESYIYITDLDKITSLRAEQLTDLALLCTSIQTIDLVTTFSDLGIDTNSADYAKIMRMVRSGLIIKHKKQVMVNPDIMLTRNVTTLVHDRRVFNKQYKTQLHPVTGVPLIKPNYTLSVHGLLTIAKFSKKQRHCFFKLIHNTNKYNIVEFSTHKHLKCTKRDMLYVIEVLRDLRLLHVVGTLNIKADTTVFLSPLLLLKSFYRGDVLQQVFDNVHDNKDVTSIILDVDTLLKQKEEKLGWTS